MHGFLHHIHFPHLQYGIRVRCLQPQTVIPFFAVSRSHSATGGHEKTRLVTLQQQVPYLILVPANRMIVPKRNEYNFIFQNVNILCPWNKLGSDWTSRKYSELTIFQMEPSPLKRMLLLSSSDVDKWYVSQGAPCFTMYHWKVPKK